MRLTLPFPDFNLSNLPDWAMGYLFSKGMDYLLKNRKKILRPKNLGKNFGWFQIFTLAICFIASYKIQKIFEKIHAKPLVTFMHNNEMQILKLGFRVLKRIEPDLALYIYKKLEAFVRVYEVGDITGVYDWDSVIKE